MPGAASSGSQMIELPGGLFPMGSTGEAAYPADGEGPVHDVELNTFSIGSCAVTNAQFAEFAAATGFVTEAQRFGWSFVFAGLLPDDFSETRSVASAPWWRQVFGADWSHPEGPQSDLDGRSDHPVVHVSWSDAQAFCTWSGTRLPTEAEWEYAAAGGLESSVFPWGDELEPNGEHRMNVFQGVFPAENWATDGWVGTAPVAHVSTQWVRPVQHDRQCVGVVCRLVRSGLLRAEPAARPQWTGSRHPSRDAWRFLPLPRLVLPSLPRFGTQRQHAGQLDGQPRVPRRYECVTICFHLRESTNARTSCG